MNPTHNLGQLITTDQDRDAIHIAIAPVTAGELLDPGQRIGFRPDGAVVSHATTIGIVDPFLTKSVREGQRCWMLLLPNTITGLRHEWSHPSFQPATKPTTSEQDVSQAWLEDMAGKCGVSYNRMMAAAESGESINMGDNEEYSSYWDADAFEKHYGIVMGKPPGSTWIFSCSC